MDINLIGQLRGIPFNLIGQISDPPFWNSAIIAAALSAILVSFANLWLDHRRDKKFTNQRRQQAYCMLKGQNAVIAEFYESYATAFIKYYIEESIRHRTGVPSDPLYYKDRERQMKRSDELSKDVDIEYGKLLEILSLIPLLFSNKIQSIVNVERLNREFIKTEVKKLKEKYVPKIVQERVNQLDPPIKIPRDVLPSEQKLSPAQTQQIIDLDNALMSEVQGEIRAKIKTYIQDPVDALLVSMNNDILPEEAGAERWWQSLR